MSAHNAMNLVYFMSNDPFHFTIPTDGHFHNPQPDTIYETVSSFQNWEIFAESETRVEVQVHQNELHPAEIDTENIQVTRQEEDLILTDEMDSTLFQVVYDAIQRSTQQRMVEVLPAETWDALLSVD